MDPEIRIHDMPQRTEVPLSTLLEDLENFSWMLDFEWNGMGYDGGSSFSPSIDFFFFEYVTDANRAPPAAYAAFREARLHHICDYLTDFRKDSL